MQAIAQSWTTFAALVIPPEASPFQRKAMRLAFYAGVFCSLLAKDAMANEADDEDEKLGAMIDAMLDEYQQLKAQVQAGSD